jgi:aminocarboxymuconate-semialdehyde decarboxylase
MPDSVRNISRRPSEYLRDFYYDTCVYDVSVLEALVERVGADRIVFGSDYPVAGEEDHLAFVQSARNLSGHDVESVAGATAARLLSL